jgi:hypothetical protein
LIEAYSLARNYDTTTQKKFVSDSFRGILRTPYPSKFFTTSIKREAPEKSKPLGLNRRRVNATNARNPGYLVITKESVSHDSN